MRIAFSGKAGSGKSTCVNYLIKKYGGKEVKLADPIYQAMYAVQHALGITLHKDGKLLQVLGTEWGRSMHEDFWVNLFTQRLSNGNLFCSDLRFPNECKALKEHKFLIIRLERDALLRKESLLNRDSQHPSEISLDSYYFQHTVFNNGSESDLFAQLDKIIEENT